MMAAQEDAVVDVTSAELPLLLQALRVLLEQRWIEVRGPFP